MLLFVLTINLIHAQDYIPFPTNNARWVNEHAIYNTDGHGQHSYRYSYYCVSGEDTVINNHNYTKISNCSNEYRGAVRYSIGEVYFVPNNSLKEYLLYDFTVQAGDYVNVYIGNSGNELTECYVEYVDTVLINGIYRKRIHVGGGEWVEGIGNLQGLFQDLGPNVSNHGYSLYCFSQNDIFIYSSSLPEYLDPCGLNVNIEEVSDFKIDVYPNPTKGVINVSSQNHKNVKIEIYDYTGNLIFSEEFNRQIYSLDISNYPNGIYLLKQKIGTVIKTEKVIKY